SMRFEHIPHPYPLLPFSNSTVKEKSTKRGFFSKFSSKKAELPAAAGPKEQYQMAIAFNAATNVERLGTSFKGKSSVLFKSDISNNPHQTTSSSTPSKPTRNHLV